MPSSTMPTPAGSLPSGAYVLMVAMGGGICVFTGGIVGVTVPTNVQVAHSGNTIAVRPDDSTATFRMDLQMNGANLSGTASGQYRSSATPVTVTGNDSDAVATAAGIATGSGASGGFVGTVSIPNASCRGTGNSWALMPR